jgi:hypothetical protein
LKNKNRRLKRPHRASKRATVNDAQITQYKKSKNTNEKLSSFKKRSFWWEEIVMPSTEAETYRWIWRVITSKSSKFWKGKMRTWFCRTRTCQRCVPSIQKMRDRRRFNWTKWSKKWWVNWEISSFYQERIKIGTNKMKAAY